MKQKYRNLFMFLFGVIITAFAISTFTLPNKIVGGGVSGVSTILFHTLGIQAGVSTLIINVILLVIGLKILGKKFVIATLIGSSLLSVFIEIFSFIPPLTQNTFLATIFGGVIYGTGIGLALASGASTGGTDILGRILQYFLPYFPIGKLLMFVDGLVIFASLICFGNIELTLYGIIMLFVSTFTIDTIIRKLNVSKLAFIVTSRGEEIARKLVDTSPRGVTIIDAKGAYTNEQTKMLVCALKNNELPDFQRKILGLDPSAFVIYSESSQIVGKGFRVYR